MVSFSEWSKMELRIAKIVSIEDIAGKDKLYKLEIDIGEEKHRTLVAGLKPYYSKEQLKGKQIVIVANLDARQLAGIASQGMLLAVKNKKEKFSLLTIEEEAKPGEKIE